MKTNKLFLPAIFAAILFLSSCKNPVDPPPDLDNDGIADAQDQCPSVAGVSEFGGCPPPPRDRDNDGTPAAQDNCPDTPGDREYNGCPFGKVDVCSGNSPYSHYGYKWSNLMPVFQFSSSLPSAWRNETEYAASTWNAVNAGIEIRVNRTIVSNGVGQDNKNVVSYGPISSSKLGVTYGWYNTSTRILSEADIRLNSNYSFSIGESSNKYDVRSVLTHEFGHFLGLDHVSDRTHTMYPEGYPDSIIYRTLCAGDKLGLLRLY